MSTLKERVAAAKGLTYEQATGFVYKDDPRGAEPCPDWPNDLNAAWELVEEMRATDTTVVLTTGLYDTVSGKQPFFNCEAGFKDRDGASITEAICIAYLVWKGARA